jgi:beta-N-acetylhexosaminidase
VDAVAAGRLSERRLNEAAARMVALAGGDPRAVSCIDVDLPRMAAAPVPATVTTTTEPVVEEYPDETPEEELPEDLREDEYPEELTEE